MATRKKWAFVFSLVLSTFHQRKRLVATQEAYPGEELLMKRINPHLILSKSPNISSLVLTFFKECRIQIQKSFAESQWRLTVEDRANCWCTSISTRRWTSESWRYATQVSNLPQQTMLPPVLPNRHHALRLIIENIHGSVVLVLWLTSVHFFEDGTVQISILGGKLTTVHHSNSYWWQESWSLLALTKGMDLISNRSLLV